MQWRIHGERQVWGSQWLSVRSLDVEQPDGLRCEYHAVRLSDVAAAVVTNADQQVLMMWRHRFLTDTWAWELPMGIVEPDETPAQAAAREVEEETGWRPARVTPLIYAQPAAGIMDAAHHVFWVDEASYVGEPVERNESDRIEWIPLTQLPALVGGGEIVSGITLVGLQQLQLRLLTRG